MMNATITNKTAAYNGALVAVSGIFAYSLIVMLYAIVRSSISIYNIMPSSERNIILWANGFSMSYSVAVFSLLMAVVSALVGAVAGLVLRKVLLRFNPQLHFKKAILLSSFTALVLLAALYFLLYALLKERITFQYAETFLFWYASPSAIFYMVMVLAAIKLNKYLQGTGKCNH
jgi:CBS domain containing-hemolysin-like protein